MNREEAIEMLKKDKEQRGDCFISDAIDMAIKALEQKPCGDYISREDAIMCMTGEYVADMTYKPEDIISKHIQRLRALPPVTPQEPSYNSVNSLAESKLKNPKAKNFDILRFVADNAGLSTYEAIEKAYNMGVSEQEAVLDKIRAEIEQDMEQERFARSVFRGEEKDAVKAEQCTGSIYAFHSVIGLIDKYKAESEDNE